LGPKLATDDLVDEGAGLGQTGIDDLPHHASFYPGAPHETLTLEDGKVLRHVRSADPRHPSELAGPPAALTEQVEELVSRRVGQSREDRCVDRVALSFVVHEVNVAKLRNFETY